VLLYYLSKFIVIFRASSVSSLLCVFMSISTTGNSVVLSLLDLHPRSKIALVGRRLGVVPLYSLFFLLCQLIACHLVIVCSIMD
jgi:hypothetical protein